jgi:hypothetical protein
MIAERFMWISRDGTNSTYFFFNLENLPRTNPLTPEELNQEITFLVVGYHAKALVEFLLY